MIITGCAASPRAQPVADEEITLLFAGDIMAHKPNFNMRGYSKIWEDIRNTVGGADFAFANIEAPVDRDLPYSSFPDFNMQPEYPQSAIEAGFNVFSLVNNHTNDQGLEGMRKTLEWALEIENRTSETERKVYFSGINRTSGDSFSYRVIKKDCWTILFVAVTEILNRPYYTTYMNYVPYTEKGRSDFSQYVRNLRIQNPCDIFVLSIHSDEEEYVAEVLQKRKDYYHNLLDSGADVIMANHPHIIREREIVGDASDGKLKKIIMYGNGNVISGQRWQPQFDNPENGREHTGDGLMLEVVFSKKYDTDLSKNVIIKDLKPFYITTYINTNWEFIIKNLDESFVEYLRNVNRKEWASYIKSRIQICGGHKEYITWQ